METQITQRVRELHSGVVAIDLHSDIMLDVMLRRSKGEEAILKNIHVPKMRAGGVDAAIIPVAWDEPSLGYTMDKLLNNLKYLANEIRECHGEIAIATCASDVKKGLISFILGLEGCYAIGYELENLELLHKLGVRVLGLTWNIRNQISDGIGERTNCGLSNFGMRVVEKANELGMLIDVSHISEAGLMDVLEISKHPVIASHSNARSICDHIRNLTDEQIMAIAEGGGIIGMVFYSEFVSKDGQARIDDLLKHVDYIANLVGVKHIAIGPDFADYIADLLLNILKKHPSLYRTITYVNGLEDVTKLPNLTAELLVRGYSKDDVKKILGENFLRVFGKVSGSDC